MSDDPITHESEPHWLVRPGTIRILWIVFIIVLALTVVPDPFIHQHDYFGIEDSFGFFAWFGFLSCVAMVLLAKLMGFVLKRKEEYYD